MDSELLSGTFVELADTMVADFDIIDFLHMLTDRSVALLAASAAGVVLADPRGELRVAAATSDAAGMAVQRILQHALRVRDRYRQRRMSAPGVAIARGHLLNQLNALIDRPGAAHVARRFAAHLAVEFPAVFTFLLEPDAIDATNWRAEHALRPAVVARKVCGGNRSERGAQTHAVLTSLLRTIQQRHLDAGAVVSQLLRSPKPITALAPPNSFPVESCANGRSQSR